MKEIIKVIAKCIFRRDYREELIRREIKGCIETVASGDGSGKNKIMILQRGNTEVGFFSDYIVFLQYGYFYKSYSIFCLSGLNHALSG